MACFWNQWNLKHNSKPVHCKCGRILESSVLYRVAWSSSQFHAWWPCHCSSEEGHISALGCSILTALHPPRVYVHEKCPPVGAESSLSKSSMNNLIEIAMNKMPCHAINCMQNVPYVFELRSPHYSSTEFNLLVHWLTDSTQRTYGQGDCHLGIYRYMIFNHLQDIGQEQYSHIPHLDLGISYLAEMCNTTRHNSYSAEK